MKKKLVIFTALFAILSISACNDNTKSNTSEKGKMEGSTTTTVATKEVTKGTTSAIEVTETEQEFHSRDGRDDEQPDSSMAEESAIGLETSIDNAIQAVVQLPVVSEEETRWYIRVDENGDTLEEYSSLMTEVIYDHTRNKAQINLNELGDYLIVVDLKEGSDSVVTDKTFSIYTSVPSVVGSADVIISEMDMTIESDIFGTLLYTRGG